MAATIDDVFTRIGQCRQYQWYLMSIVGYSFIIAALSVMIVTLITAEPDWKCVDGFMNNTVCRFNNSITLTSDDYRARCDMPRGAWTFVDDFTSIVTEVRIFVIFHKKVTFTIGLERQKVIYQNRSYIAFRLQVQWTYCANKGKPDKGKPESDKEKPESTTSSTSLMARKMF